MGTLKFRHGLCLRVYWLVSLVSAAPAHAQAEDRAAARALFDEGRQLMAAERYDAACPKFEAARKLAQSTGVLLNLGECYERLGRTASAWDTKSICDLRLLLSFGLWHVYRRFEHRSRGDCNAGRWPLGPARSRG